jgi:hypothetical protein
MEQERDGRAVRHLAGRIANRLARASLIVGVAAVVIVGASLVGPGAPARTLAAGTDFTITGTLSALPGCTGSALLFPGVDRCLTYQVHNNLAVPITVGTLSIASVAAPVGCPASNLDLTRTTYTGSFTVPANGTVSSPGLRISLLDTTANQDACKNVTFSFVYTGGAGYTLPPTSTDASQSTGSGSIPSTMLLLAGLAAVLAIVVVSRRARAAAAPAQSSQVPAPVTPSVAGRTARTSAASRRRRSRGPDVPPPGSATLS